MRVLNFTVEEQLPREGDAWDNTTAVVKLEGEVLFTVPVGAMALMRHGDQALVDAVVDWIRGKLGDAR